jgi:hypothetical protein
MLTPGKLDLSLVRGDTFTLTFHFQTNAVPPVAIDLSGRSFTAQIRRSYDDEIAVSMDVDDSDAATGDIVVGLDADITADISLDGVWDLQETDGARVTTYIRGVVELVKDVTR